MEPAYWSTPTAEPPRRATATTLALAATARRLAWLALVLCWMPVISSAIAAAAVTASIRVLYREPAQRRAWGSLALGCCALGFSLAFLWAWITVDLPLVEREPFGEPRIIAS